MSVIVVEKNTRKISEEQNCKSEGPYINLRDPSHEDQIHGYKQEAQNVQRCESDS